MNNENTTLYRNELGIEAFGAFLPSICFAGGIALVELHGRNVLQSIQQFRAAEHEVLDIVSGRFFDGKRQLKFRRVRDDLFWLVADYPINGWRETAKGLAFKREYPLILWGYTNPELPGVLYEERIPCLFKYPGMETLSGAPRERMAVTIHEFCHGDTFPAWDRFVCVKKWENADGK